MTEALRLQFGCHIALLPPDPMLALRAQARVDLQAGMAEMLTWDVLDLDERWDIFCWCFGLIGRPKLLRGGGGVGR